MVRNAFTALSLRPYLKEETGGARSRPTLPAVPQEGLKGESDLICVSTATSQQSQAAWARGVELGIEAKFCELGNEALGFHVLRAAIEMIGTEILELGTVLEHVVDGREQRGSDRAGCFLWSASAAETIELGIKVAALFALRGPGTLDQKGLEPRVALAQPGGTALAGTLVVAWT